MLEDFDKTFESRVRLGIMAILMVNDWVEFLTFKELLNLTDGNLASHIASLEKMDYLEVKKAFIGRKPSTSYKATKKGRNAFNKHLKAIESLIKK